MFNIAYNEIANSTKLKYSVYFAHHVYMTLFVICDLHAK